MIDTLYSNKVVVTKNTCTGR